MKKREETRPCEHCGALVTRTASEAGNRFTWTCNRACATALRNARWNAEHPDAIPRGAKETRLCAECGEPVTRRLSQRIHAEHWFCSLSCKSRFTGRERVASGEWFQPTKPRRGTETPCETCGAPVYATAKGRANGLGRFCSNACQAQWQVKDQVVKSCAYCGKEMRLKPSQAVLQHCSVACAGEARTARAGRLLERTHNGRPARLTGRGYVMVWEPGHPNAIKGWYWEHRVVMEKSLGRLLERDEQIHHRNGQRDDNSISNLQVVSPQEHTQIEQAQFKAKVAQLSELDQLRARLADYERRFGPLPDITPEEAGDA
jgi:endogenous inhibitor of DNA gyrase (YacG/DUF329 family)